MRRTPSHKLVALLLAMCMPLCCCQLHLAGALLLGAGSGDDAAAANVASGSCCSQCLDAVPSDEQSSDSKPSDGCCDCCMKFASAAPDWSPPVDTIGLELPAWVSLQDHLTSEQERAPAHHGIRTGPRDAPPQAAMSLVVLHCALLL